MAKYQPPAGYDLEDDAEQEQEPQPKRPMSIGERLKRMRWGREHKGEAYPGDAPESDSKNRYDGKYQPQEPEPKEEDSDKQPDYYKPQPMQQPRQMQKRDMPNSNALLFNYLVENGHLDSMEFKLTFADLKKLLEEI